ncbi:MAG: uridine kinase [Alphaproteobacteria bacterium]|nr:uridine kinase [Alphaproteobacteria bacterium]MCB9693194.1 uridine kinase [Alphaproteobacteria bacterium]
MQIIGIAGGTASGKTTLARRVAAALGPRAVLLAHDRYYRTLPDAYRGREVDYNFDHPDALDNQLLAANLDALVAGASTRVPDYDFAVCRQHPESTWETLSGAGVEVVLVEGILVLAVESLRVRFHRSFFVHTPADIRLARRLRRDIVERGDTVEGVLDQYLATVRPMHEVFVEPSREHAEHVLDGTADLERSVADVVRRLRR